MDAAKGVAVLSTNDGAMRDYAAGATLHSDPLPIACVPTTSGTGSEVTPYAVFTDNQDQTKGGFSHPKIFPLFSIIDPELTFSMPPAVVVDTGLDALTHAIEAFLSTLSNPLSDTLAWHAIEIVRNRLASAASREPEAMCDMSYAAMIAGIAITHAGTTLLHVMGYPLTVFHQVAHGRANAALLPAFMAFMQKHGRTPAKVDRLRSMFERTGGFAGFVESAGVPTRLSSYGVTEDELDVFVAKCVVKDDLKITPAHVTADDIRDIFRHALMGRTD
jgi:alcohol dehydrogenase class IV